MLFSLPWIMLGFLTPLPFLSVPNISFRVFLQAIDLLVIYGSLSVHLEAYTLRMEMRVHPYVLL